MEGFSSFFESQSSSGWSSWSYDSLDNFCQISPLVRNHLKRIYLTLCCALVASAAGAYLHILWNIAGLLTIFGCIGSIVWLFSTSPRQEQKRVSLLMAAAMLQGASIGPVVGLGIRVNPSILVSAFVGCAVAYGFSVATMLARRREYLYLAGRLPSGISIWFCLLFASFLFGGSAALKFELYSTLLVFVGYFVVDTQDIIEKAHFGDLDYVKHALTLFMILLLCLSVSI